MTFLPIVERELRVAARRRSTYRTRFFAAGSMMAVWLFLLGINHSAPAARLASILFIALGVLALGFAMFAGVFLTADCLSEEKREETLGLLFLTDLKGYDVVLGKLAATSLHAVYGLLAVFPLLGLPVLMGGVSGAAFWRLTLLLVVTLFLSLSLGMFVSAMNRDARSAMAGTFAGMVWLAGVLPAFHWLQITLFHRTWTNLFLLPSPTYTFSAALDASYATGAHRFWESLQMVGWLGVGFLGLAAVLLPRTWQTKTSPTQAETPPTAGKDDLGFADPDDGRTVRDRLRRGHNPFLWLASRRPAVRTREQVTVGLILAVWLCCLIATLSAAAASAARAQQSFSLAMLAACVLHVVIKCLVAGEATRQLNEDRQSGALELLLVSPLREADMLHGQARALWHKFRGWLILLTAVNLAMSATTLVFSGPLVMRGKDLLMFQGVLCGGISVLWLDFKAIGTVGMWMALRTPRHHWAVMHTLARVMVPAWAAIFLVVFFLSTPRGISQDAVTLVFGAWFLFGWLVDLVMLGMARQHLRRGFRAVLAETKSGH